VAGLETIDVDPTSQNQGIGLHLLKAAEQEMIHKGIKKIRLEVSATNHAAITLYKKEGFKIISRIKEYYLYKHDGSRDALKMIKELS
jgi:ribosomal-protein-alanine N-acetyltransferase